MYINLITDIILQQTILTLLKVLAEFGDTGFVDTFTEICILAKVNIQRDFYLSEWC